MTASRTRGQSAAAANATAHMVRKADGSGAPLPVSRSHDYPAQTSLLGPHDTRGILLPTKAAAAAAAAAVRVHSLHAPAPELGLATPRAASRGIAGREGPLLFPSAQIHCGSSICRSAWSRKGLLSDERKRRKKTGVAGIFDLEVAPSFFDDPTS